MSIQKIQIMEPVHKIREFKSIDEFNLFYNENKQEFEESTTHMLNKKYSIPGHRITKIQGKVMLKRAADCKKTTNDKINGVSDRTLSLEQKVNAVIQNINIIIDKCNAASAEVKEVRAEMKQMKQKIAELETKLSTVNREPKPIEQTQTETPQRQRENANGWDNLAKERAKPEKTDEKKVQFDNSGPNPMKRNASPRRPGQMMESAMEWLK